MIKFNLLEFKVEKGSTPMINFKSEIVVPEAYRYITFIYDNGKLMVNGSELNLGYSIYEIERRLESLLETNLIHELRERSRSVDYTRLSTTYGVPYLRSFALYGMPSQTGGTEAELYYAYNDKFLRFGNVLITQPSRVREELCEVPLRVETDSVTNIESFYELLTAICRSSARISVDLNNVNEIIEILLQEIGF